jgi:hypothetical protein
VSRPPSIRSRTTITLLKLSRNTAAPRYRAVTATRYECDAMDKSIDRSRRRAVDGHDTIPETAYVGVGQ